MITALRTKNLSFNRGSDPLFSAVNLELQGGQGLVIYGANGVGKTTLLRILAGLNVGSEGELEKPADCYYLGHQPGLKSYLSVEENLRYSQRLISNESLEPAQLEQIIDRVQLTAQRQQLAKQLSAGQKRRLALARLLLSPKSLWLLDEPFTNLDQEGQAWLLSLLQEQLDRQGMVILSSHQTLALQTFKTFHLQSVAHV